jgi:NAD+ kinase
LKYYVIHRGDEKSIQLCKQFHDLAKQANFQLDEQSPNIVISIGGDGTMLHAFHMFIGKLDSIAFVGIHTGHLGFYADWKADELESLFTAMTRTDNLDKKIVQYPVLEILIETDSGEETYYALNEFTLRGIEATLVAQVNINDDVFEMFRGDGICISTPSGSTAYNKSLGGALSHPSLEAIQIAEIASINNRVYRTLGSSLLLPKHHHCDIYPTSNHKLLLSVDHLQLDYENLKSIRCRVADQKVNFARYRSFPFWNRVREAFIGLNE